jgi:Carbohydrate family 9 binding domain-like
MWRWLLVVLAGCYAPTPPDGVPCSEAKTCPTGQSCFFDRCYVAAPPCVEIAADAGRIDIPRIETPLALDGSLADWPTCFIDVDPSTAGLVRDLSGTMGLYAAGRFSLAMIPDDDRIFLGAEVTIVPPLGNAPVPNIYENNAISTYFDADGVTLTNRYDADAAQIVVDHANRTAAFRSGTGVVTVPDVQSAARVGDTTFVIEMSIRPSTLGRTAFAPEIGFDIGLVGGNGDVMVSELVWFQACTRPTCGCAGTDSAPYCDARQFGRARLP